MPTTSPVASDTPMVKSRTPDWSPIDSAWGRIAAAMPRSATSVARATTTPSAPPTTARTALSVSSCLNESRARGAEGGANRDFATAAGSAREQEVGDVGADDEEHDAHRAEQDEERRSHLADDRAGEAHDLDAARVLRVGELEGEPTRDDGEVRHRARRVDAGGEPADDGERVVAAIGDVADAPPIERDPEIVMHRRHGKVEAAPA